MRRVEMKVDVKDCVLDGDYYPRHGNKTHWPTIAKYKAAMENKEEFPPIEVVKGTDGKWIVLCGWHRTLAARAAKLTSLSAVNLKGLHKREWFYHAALDNAKHGRAVSSQDRCMIAERLKREGRSAKLICQCIQVLAYELPKWIDRVRTNEDGEIVVAKMATLPALGTLNEGRALAYQGVLATPGTRQTLDQMLGLLNCGLIDVNEPSIRDRAVKIHEKLGNLLKV